MLHCLDAFIRATGAGRGIVMPGLLVLLSACTVGPDYRQPESEAPAHWQGSAESGEVDAAQLAQWWKQFKDPVLDHLIKDALAANIDLQTAQAQWREARARRGIARGNLWPGAEVSVGASHSKTGRNDSRKLYNAGFDASWEPDIFGGLQRGLEAATADLEARQELLHSTRVSLVAEVARNYIELRTYEKRLVVAETSLVALADTYELTRWRHQAGMVSELDALQVRTQLEQTRAGLPVLHSAIAETRYRLAILLGQQPGQLNDRLQQADTNIPSMSEKIMTGIPADTLRQRPDVRASERQLAAQTARLGVAEAARYPALRLSGSLGLEALSMSGLDGSDAVTRSLLGSLSAPIFDAGRIRSNIAVQDALLEQARLGYQSAVLNALEEVENALVRLANTQLRQRELQQAVASASEAAQLTLQQYKAGMADFLDVLDSQRTLLNLEDVLASNSGDVSNAQIQLYKALGGGWEADEEQPKATQDKATQDKATQDKASQDKSVIKETL